MTRVRVHHRQGAAHRAGASRVPGKIEDLKDVSFATAINRDAMHRAYLPVVRRPSTTARRGFPTVDPGSAAAWLATFALHFFLAAFLLRDIPRQAGDVESETFVTLTFIDRPRLTLDATVRRPVSHSLNRRAPVATSAPAVPAMPRVNDATAPPTSAAPGRSASAAPLDLSVHEAEVTYVPRDPLKARAPSWEASIPRMHVRMGDNSFAGKLRAMQKGSICAELRSALRGQPADPMALQAMLASMAPMGATPNNNADTASIVTSMAEQGCAM